MPTTFWVALLVAKRGGGSFILLWGREVVACSAAGAIRGPVENLSGVPKWRPRVQSRGGAGCLSAGDVARPCADSDTGDTCAHRCSEQLVVCFGVGDADPQRSAWVRLARPTIAISIAMRAAGKTYAQAGTPVRTKTMTISTIAPLSPVIILIMAFPFVWLLGKSPWNVGFGGSVRAVDTPRGSVRPMR